MMNTLNVYILDGPITRSYHGNVSYLFHVPVNEEAQVYDIYVKDQKGAIFEKLQSGKCYMLLNAVKVNVDKGCYVKLKEVSGRKGDTVTTDVTKVYSIPLFTYNKPAYEGFFHAPVVPLQEVMRSPDKKRVSVTGRVANVSPLVAKANWRRQELQLVDDDDNASKITVKLWNENAGLVNDGHVDKKICIENVEIDSWGSAIAVRDTCQTTVNDFSRVPR
ncbi:uncharacterized protein LOC135496315 [Lineus longissimus]|uniref:uncharacterized protein LOC135496315 n=1 Tax=Lineus longissimus TaxID=88925 RepID=UPI00315DB915